MEVIEYRLGMRALFFEGFLKIGVHIAGDSFDMIHPFQADMLNKVVYDLLLLAACDPQDMSSLHVDDVSCIPVSVVQLEFINTKEFRILLRLNKLSVRSGVKLLKTCPVDFFYNVPAKAGKFCDFLVCVSPAGQKIAGILMQLSCDSVSGSFKGNISMTCSVSFCSL